MDNEAQRKSLSFYDITRHKCTKLAKRSLSGGEKQIIVLLNTLTTEALMCIIYAYGSIAQLVRVLA